MIILEILGVVFVIVLLVISYFGWKIYRYFKRNISPHSPFNLITGSLPQFVLHLEPLEGIEWDNEEQRKLDLTDLKKLGAKHCGDYAQFLTQQTIYISLWLYKESVVMVSYEAHPHHAEGLPAHYCSEVYLRLNNGGSLCVSNSEFADTLPRPSEDILHIIDEKTFPELLKQLKKSIPGGVKALKIADAKKCFKQAYEEHSLWVWQNERLRSDHLQSVFAPLGIAFDDDLLQNLFDYRDGLMEEVYTEKIKEKLANSGKFTASQWNAMCDRLIVVHERLPMGRVSDLLMEVSNGLSEDEEDQLYTLSERGENADPLGCFSLYISKLGDKVRIKRIGQISKPISAHIYLNPVRE